MPQSPAATRPPKSSPHTGSGREAALDGNASRGALTSVAWVPRQDLGKRDWLKAGHRLGTVGRCSQWWIGDWIRYGNSKWGEKYSEAARVTGYDPASLRNMAWVASRFEPS